MQTSNQNVVSKKLAPYFSRKGFKDAGSLLKAVRKAVEDIKKEKPCLAELNIGEISFLRDQKSGIILKVYFDECPQGF
ncbi:MAG: hypothetical protein GX334_02440 [Firmicutes bacterium]|nr:hypothetical protein [Bacillota bacterium]